MFVTPFSYRLVALLSAAAITLSIVTVQSTIGVEAPASASTTTPGFGVGAKNLAVPATGARYIYVAANGTDLDREFQAWYNGGDYKEYSRYTCLTDPTKKSWGSQSRCTEPTIANPLRTVKLAMRIARPGDVIVVRGGTYTEAIGWGIVAGTATRPITLQARPGEAATISGTMTLSNAHYWRVAGLRFIHNASIQQGQSVVTIAGGTGWRFENNLVTGSTGVANVMVISSRASSTSSTALRAAAPNAFTIRGNCITNNRGTGPHGQYHNLYVMSSVYSTGGVIERNLFAGAPRGANIKAAAANPQTGWTSPKNLKIADNTLMYAASGVTVGLQAQYIEITGNLIARPSNELQYDGAVKTYQMSYAPTIGFKDGFVADYKQVVEYDYAAPQKVFVRRIHTGGAVFSGSVSSCSVKPTSSAAAQYGHLAP